MQSPPPSSIPLSRSDVRQANAWARYRENIARHLIGIARDYQSRVMGHLTDVRGFPDLRLSFGPLLSLVAIEPRPLRSLAAELSISPQACSQLANLAERAGYLARRADPVDGRSKRLILTDQGQRLVSDAIAISREVEDSYRALIGAAAYSRFVTALGSLYRGLDLPTQGGGAPGSGSNRGETAGVLPLISVRIQQDLMTATMARGHAGLKMSYGLILPLIGPGGGRVHAIAKLHGVTRQAISATALDLEGLGYLSREADPGDRRGVVLRLTAFGNRLIEDSVTSLGELEASLREILGTSRLDDLERTACDLYRSLRLETDIFEDPMEGSTGPRPSNGRPSPSSAPDIHQLAATLRRQLGSRDAARLAALLEPRPDSRGRQDALKRPRKLTPPDFTGGHSSRAHSSRKGSLLK